MNPLFKNVTNYNEKNYEQFLQFHHKKYSFSYNSYTLIMTLLLIFCVVLNIIEKNILFMFLFILAILAFLLFRVYLPIRRFRKMQEQFDETEESSFTFSFYNLYFTLNDKTFYYFKLYRVFETDEYFYLYVNDENAALISKTGFEVGTVEEFSKFIKKKCFFKYSKQK